MSTSVTSQQPTDRPVALAVIPENTPAELKARREWTCFHYDWVIDKHDNGKWAKVPYIPGTTRKASHSYPKTWCSIEEAYAAYQQASDYCAGLFFAFVV